MLLYFFLVNRRRTGEERSSLPVAAAALAMQWNLGSLVALAAGPRGGQIAGAIVALSFSVLSLLPAVLLHICLQSRRRAVWIGGYVLSGVAVALHLADWLSHVPGLRLKKIVRKAGAEYFLLDANEIFAFHAEGDIVWIATARKRYQATQTLKVLEERPLNTSFQRIRRLVNW